MRPREASEDGSTTEGSPRNGALTPRWTDLYSGHAGLRFLYRSLGRGNPLVGSLGFFVAWAAIFTVVSLAEGTSFWPEEKRIGWVEDHVYISTLVMFFVMFWATHRALARYYAFLTEENQLPDGITFGPAFTREQYAAWVARDIDFIQCRTPRARLVMVGVTVLCVLSILYSGVYLQVFKLPPVDIWHLGHYPASYVFWLVFQFLVIGYLLPAVLYRAVAVILSVRGLMRRLSQAGVLHVSPVTQCGVYGVGRVALALDMVALSPIIPITVWFLVREVSAMIVFVFPIFILAVVLVFYLPLVPAHRAMKSAKQRLLGVAETEMKAQYARMADIACRPGEPTDADAVSILRTIDELHGARDRLDELREWPVEFGVLQRFLSIIAIPLVIFAINLVSNADSIIYNLDKFWATFGR